MANKLYRTGFYYDTAEVVGRPATPAYTYTYTERISAEMILSDGVLISASGTASSGSAGGWSANPWVWVPSGTSSSNKIYTITRTVYVPAQPAIPAIPAARVFSPPRGWTAFAHSIAAIARGKATFSVASKVAGVVVGMAKPVSSPPAGYGHIPDGLLFANGQVAKLPENTPLGSYTTNDTFAIVVADGMFTYFKGGVQISSAPSPYAAAEMLALSSVMYGPQDSVDNPVLTASGTSYAATPGLSAFGGNAASASSVAKLPRIKATSSARTRSVAAFPRLKASSSRGKFANSVARTPRIDVQSYGGTPAIVVTSESYARLSRPQAVSTLLVGQVGNGTARLPAAASLSGDHVYGTSSAKFTPLSASSYEGSRFVGFVPTVSRLDVGLSARSVYSSSLSTGFGLDVHLSGDVASDAAIDLSVSVDVGISLSSTETVSVDEVFWFDAPIDSPGAFMDAWSVNLKTGATTQYLNYPFDTVANIGGRHFGGAFEGLFELGGDTDAGAPIEARFDVGQKLFGSPQLKRIEQIYLGITSNGQMHIKVTAEGASYTYPMREFGEHIQMQRVTVGKGLRANYFGFEIGNTDGADFEVTSLNIMVAESARKV